MKTERYYAWNTEVNMIDTHSSLDTRQKAVEDVASPLTREHYNIDNPTKVMKT